MKILLSGASGFLGQAIERELSSEQLLRLGRSGADLYFDLTEDESMLPAADLVIHAAGRAHSVPRTEKESRAFYDINYKGTARLLEALEKADRLPSSFVFISSVAVYGLESGEEIDENTPLNAKDPYGHSKILAEECVREWCQNHHVTCAILRLPLLAGTNPPGNLKAMIRGIQRGYYVNIGGGVARKSMVMIEDVAKILLKAAASGGIFHLTDGRHPSFAELSKVMAEQLNKKKPLNLPLWAAELLAAIGRLMGRRAPLDPAKLRKITSSLTFSDAKARQVLGWSPRSVIEYFKI